VHKNIKLKTYRRMAGSESAEAMQQVLSDLELESCDAAAGMNSGDRFDLVIRVNMLETEHGVQQLERSFECTMVENNTASAESNIILVPLAANGIPVQSSSAKRYAFLGKQRHVMQYLSALMVFMHSGTETFLITDDGAVVRPDLGPDEISDWDANMVSLFSGSEE